MPDSPPASARERAARTKRERSRRALLEAAAELFAAQGWLPTRLEDVARRAGVSTATTYNHFPTKHALIAHVYAPLVAPPIERARALRAQGRDAVAVLEEHVRDLAVATREHEALTVPFVFAVQDHSARTGRAPDPADDADPRIIAPLAQLLGELIVQGQEDGTLRPFPPGRDFATQVLNLLLLRVMNRRGEPAELTAEIVLTVLFGALRPEVLVDAGRDGRPFAR
ncbi:TetR/AcrR family transcriptional regulator [Actinomycetospora cinnamomea]|uniref:TetR family transcriptional regulator n=1 Tax=Actinomycetospora cinnamomea TaxID=663609 RepID=A0A2U1EW47_9PSEU|nr:TetR/AcrR family transcriptional regulator [Actinomycetospora cinnamomea]PVZ03940.1 TetR family transcriptional regulator [Actinomycetospora cinnamomea]